MNPFKCFAICCVLNQFNPGKCTLFFLEGKLQNFFFHLCFSVTLRYLTNILHSSSFICVPYEVMSYLYLVESATFLSCLLYNFFNLPIFTSPRPLRFWVLQVKLTIQASCNCCKECPNELIIITMSLNKYAVLEDKVFCHFWEGNSYSASSV